jgi:nucleotide-binding universal stress UspA family protein
MRILLGIDGSRYSQAAVRFVARHLALPGAEVDLVHVISPAEGEPRRPQVRDEDQARRRFAAPETWLAQAKGRLEAHGSRLRTQTRRGLPTQWIPALAAKGGYDLVVLGAKGRSDLPRLDIGSVALAALEHAPVSVLLVREREPARRKKQVATKMRPLSVLFATDGGAHSIAAITTFFALFGAVELRATALAVAEELSPESLRRLSRAQRGPLLRAMRAASHAWLEDAADVLARHVDRADVRALTGRPASALVAEAAKVPNGLLVLGSRTPTRRAGSVALEVVRTAPCSVLLAKGGR